MNRRDTGRAQSLERTRVDTEMRTRLVVIAAVSCLQSGCLTTASQEEKGAAWLDGVAADIGMESLWTYETGDGPIRSSSVVDLYEIPRPFGNTACQSTLFSATVDHTPTGLKLSSEHEVTEIRLLALPKCDGVRVSDFNFVFDGLKFDAVLEAMSYLSSVLGCSTKACFELLNVSFGSGVAATSLPGAEESFNWEVRSGPGNSVRVMLMHAVRKGELLAVDVIPTSPDGEPFRGDFYTEYFHIVNGS